MKQPKEMTMTELIDARARFENLRDAGEHVEYCRAEIARLNAEIRRRRARGCSVCDSPTKNGLFGCQIEDQCQE